MSRSSEVAAGDQAMAEGHFNFLRDDSLGFFPTNRSGSSFGAGAVVVQDTGSDSSFTVTTTEADLIIGVVAETIANSASGLVQDRGECSVTVDAATAHGNWLVSASTAGRASPKAALQAGAFARASGSTSGSGTVAALMMRGLPIDAAGHMALGDDSVSSAEVLAVTETWDDFTASPGADRVGVYAKSIANETGTDAWYEEVWGLRGVFENTSSQNATASVRYRGGVYGEAIQNGAGTLSGIFGVRGLARKVSGGSVAEAYGGFFKAEASTAILQYGVIASDGSTIGYLGYQGLYGLYTENNAHVSGTLEFTEMTSPSAGAANTGRLYIKDNGSGSSQLIIKFSDDAEIVLATQA